MKVVPTGQFISQLAAAFAPLPQAPLLMHVDMARVGVIVDGPASRDEMLERFWCCLLEAAAPRPVVLPTFNYDFCRTGVYRPATDSCQVGVLNEFVRSHHPERRTLTPIFNFVTSGSLSLSAGPATNVFGEDSTFAELNRLGACVVLLGTDFSSNTFKHFIEEEAAVGYRYPKRFSGVIELPGQTMPVTVTYRVRPRGTLMRYDNPRLEQECRQLGVLHHALVGEGSLLWFRMDELRNHWSQSLRRDELHLLDAESRAEAQALYRRWGSPLRLEQFEPAP